MGRRAGSGGGRGDATGSRLVFVFSPPSILMEAGAGVGSTAFSAPFEFRAPVRLNRRYTLCSAGGFVFPVASPLTPSGVGDVSGDIAGGGLGVDPIAITSPRWLAWMPGICIDMPWPGCRWTGILGVDCGCGDGCDPPDTLRKRPSASGCRSRGGSGGGVGCTSLGVDVGDPI